MNRENLTILIIVGVVFFAVGVMLGILYQTQKPEVQQALKLSPTVKTLSSGVVQSISAFGQVKKIEGNKITLAYSGEELTVNIREGAQVFIPAPVQSADNTPKRANFSDIKTGNSVSITLKILPSGDVQGESVFIFPK